MMPLWAIASMLGMQGAGLGMQGVGMLKGQTPPLSQAMPVGGRPPMQMTNPYQMMNQLSPYGATNQPQDPNMMKPGLSSALRRYGGMYG